jgi:hypothetical protein
LSPGFPDLWFLLDGIQWENIELLEDRVDIYTERMILDFQYCRESIAEEWTKLQAQAIKKADAEALVGIGLIQWSVPCVLPGQIRLYSGFRPSRIARHLDFLEIHFYPLAVGFYEYKNVEATIKNLAYIECLLRETAKTGKPVIVGEFGWYGGGRLKNSNQEKPEASEEEQADYGTELIETTKGIAAGWLNWGYYDVPEAKDISELTGLRTADGREKVWNRRFREISDRLSKKYLPTKQQLDDRPEMCWDSLLSNPKARYDYMNEYYKSFQKHSGK